jgi:hypothetical protein
MPSASPPSLAPRLRGQARALALELYAEARAEWGYASDLIASAFRKQRQLGSGDRRLVAETVYGSSAGIGGWRRSLKRCWRGGASGARRCRRWRAVSWALLITSFARAFRSSPRSFAASCTAFRI